MLTSYDPTTFQAVGPSTKPTVIPELRPTLCQAFTTSWTPACGMPFTLWCTALLACWTWAVWGCRGIVDMASLKTSTDHADNRVQGWAYTSYSGGRNKLCGVKRGTRPWKAYFICMCPNGTHVPVPPDWEYSGQRTDNSESQS